MLRTPEAVKVVELVAKFMATSSVEAAVELENYVSYLQNIKQDDSEPSVNVSNETDYSELYLIGKAEGLDLLPSVKYIRGVFGTQLNATKDALVGRTPVYLQTASRKDNTIAQLKLSSMGYITEVR
jgi:hypothetical protein